MSNAEVKNRAGQEFMPYLRAYERYLLECAPHEKGLLKEAVKLVLNAIVDKVPARVKKANMVDILMLHASPGGPSRMKHLIEELEQSFRVGHELLDLSFRRPLRKRQFGRCDTLKGTGIPKRYKYVACYVSYFLQKYSPAVVITSINSGLFPPVLKVAAELYGARLINVSHGVTGRSFLHTAFTYDYYFVFGRSSLEHIEANPVRLGSTKAVLTGSPFIGRDFELPASENRKNILFLSQWLTPVAKEAILRNLGILSEWARRQKEFALYIKPHPLEDMELTRKLFGDIGGVTILDKGVSFKDALEDVALCITQWSVASLEAAVLRRPTICLNASDEPDDFLGLETYFGAKARSPQELQEKIDDVLSDYDSYVENCSGYVKRHLEHVTDSIPVIVQRLRSIHAGKEDFSFVDVPQKVDILEST